MKLTKTENTKIKAGMTLIEITVVILVLLTLISVLFIGANIYKRGADRAACILNIRNIHQAVRANQNLTNLTPGTTPLALADYNATIFSTEDDERYLVRPVCPATAGSYDPNGTAGGTYPETGTVAVICGDNGVDGTHANGITDHLPDPTDTQGW